MARSGWESNRAFQIGRRKAGEAEITCTWFSAPTRLAAGARDLSRRNVSTAQPRPQSSKSSFAHQHRLRTEVGAPSLAPGTTQTHTITSPLSSVPAMLNWRHENPAFPFRRLRVLSWNHSPKFSKIHCGRHRRRRQSASPLCRPIYRHEPMKIASRRLEDRCSVSIQSSCATGRSTNDAL